jgi:diaminohydroxyphosphoribosylaminopyrimidine deaminase / 5-amino-6-(5-phosphoribosylamino)uracil reductase
MPQTDEHWMTFALAAAAEGRGRTSPNPMVGAVIISASGELLARGRHLQAGGPHAEVDALAQITSTQRGALPQATLYVTLEPCSTQGKTPPCTAAILRSGIRRVVYAMPDPNPAHAGRARAILEAAGIEVTVGVSANSAETLLAPWSHYMRTGRPYVIAKAGMSVDGRIARRAGEGQWLTNTESRADAMDLRVWADAILVGAETVRQDDPALTVRGSAAAWKTQPWRVILTRSGKLPEDRQIFNDAWEERTIHWPGKSLLEVLTALGGLGVVGLLIEGGGQVFAEAFSAGLVNEFHVYLAPMICGTGKLAIDTTAFAGGATVDLHLKEVKSLGGDVKLVYMANPSPSAAQH